MLELDPQLLLGAARALSGVGLTGECLPGDEACDQPRDDGMDRPSWDAQFLQRCGYYSHYYRRGEPSPWPIPKEYCTTMGLAEFGEARGLIREAPRVGDIFLQWGPVEAEFIHCGVVADVLSGYTVKGKPPIYDLYTVEGDTDECGRRLGGKVMRVERKLSARKGDRFLRWTDVECAGIRQVLDLAERVEFQRGVR